MCQDCGCSEVREMVDESKHQHLDHRSINIQTSLLSQNDHIAKHNRDRFERHHVLAVNILSSPGSGKTTLLERMAREVHRPMAVLVGDLATDNDAKRLQQAGLNAIQITTGQTCHLDAAMIERSLSKVNLHDVDLLLIENVGNLVCPAHYDLGEALRVVMMAVTEGEDKTLKYPTMFKTADVVLINKVDIAEVVGFDRETAITNIQQIAPQVKIFEVSARAGGGMSAWYEYLENYYWAFVYEYSHS